MRSAKKAQLGLFPDLISTPREGEWDFTGEDTQYLTHGLHPYLAAMIPQIAAKLLELYAPPGTKVLDPFMGGGTVLLESYLADIASSGFDVNPLAVIIAKAKVTPIPSKVLISAMHKFDRLYPAAYPSVLSFPENARMAYWFKPYMFEPLARIHKTIAAVIDQATPDFSQNLQILFYCVFSNTVRDVSLTYRGEVRLRRLQGKDFERFNPDILTEFRSRLQDACRRVSGLPVKSHVPSIQEGDARKIPVADNYYDLVITSPPYGDIKNTIPYHQFSKNMLYWLEIGETALEKIRCSSLGSKTSNKVAPKSRTLRRAIGQMKKPNLIHEAICFYADYWDALRETARVTSQKIIIITGSRILDGVALDNPAITSDLMGQIGWRLEAQYSRVIRKKRIHRKMGFGNNAQGGTIDHEEILVYRK